MATVTIYEVECTKAYMMCEQGTRFSLSPWGNNTEYYEGDDDGGWDYILPDGYTVATSNCGTKEIYDDHGNHCEIIRHRSGRPQLISGGLKCPVLDLI